MSVAPWHQLCTLREDVRKGELTESEFAADLYGVRTGTAPEVYRDAGMFFSRTYPTHRLKELVRDVLQRLSGHGGNPVVRLQVAYGGGKTHTLITLLHLAERAKSVADNPTVKEFVTFAGVNPVPEARVALLPFDKLDVHEGLEVVGPSGNTRRVKTPWGALAYQLADDAGYARVQQHEQTYTAPGQLILEELLRAPQSEGKSALVLLDEAVIYCRNAVNENSRRLGTLKDFFQLLTQAVAAVPKSCIVATLIASENEADDQTGAQVLRALEDAFGRLQSTSEPVGREDLAEVLRRRLFEQVPAEQQRRPVVDALFSSFAACKQLRDAQKDNAAYQRFLHSYPFHPDLLEVFYEKWTELPKFQRTRGALRLLAQALKHSEGSDPSAFVGAHSLLDRKAVISPVITELVRICSDKDATWTPKLTGELERAREVQSKVKGLQQREIEQAVLAVFLHSQPPGRKADNPELYGLLVHPGVDLASLETGLEEWRDLSWFLSEEAHTWRLTTQPNLTHMQVNAILGLNETQISDELRAQIEKVKELAEIDRDGADRGVVVHRLPKGPREVVPDNTDLRYLVLDAACALDPAHPVPPTVVAYFTTTSGPQNPRTYRNALIALAPDIARLAGLRRSITEYLAWQAVEKSEAGKQLTPALKKSLGERKDSAEKNLPSAVRATYNVVLDLGEDGNVRAQTLKSPDALGILDTRPFARIKAMLKAEERLITGDLDPELLLRDSYFELWAEGEQSKKAQSFLDAFAQFPRLPRFLSAQVFRDTLTRGCEAGVLILRLPRPDGTARTLWRVRPTNDELTRAELEVLPAAEGELTEIAPTLLIPGVLPGLWPSATEPITFHDLQIYFDGKQAPVVQAGVLAAAVQQAVQQGLLWARGTARTYLKEQVPSESLTESLELLTPPPPVSPEDLLPASLPEAWREDQADLESISVNLAKSRGYGLPWPVVSEAVNAALQSRRIEVSSGLWPCGADQAGQVVIKLRVAKPGGGTPPPIPQPPHDPQPGVLSAEASLTAFEMQKLGEVVDEIASTAPTLKVSFNLLITAEGGEVDPATVAALNALLAKASAKLKFDE